MNRSTLFAVIGVAVFALIIVTVVTVASRGNNELGRVYNEKQGSAKDFMRIVEESVVNETNALPVHDALRTQFGVSQSTKDAAVEAE